jgi:hypothetical protein
VLSVDDKMIIKLHNWIYFLTSITFIIEGKGVLLFGLMFRVLDENLSGFVFGA